MKRSFVAIIFTILILLVAGAIYGAVLRSENQPDSPTPSTTATLSNYTDATAGFKISYPQELIPTNTAPNYLIQGSNVSGQVLTFPSSYSTNTNLVEAFVTAQAEDGGQSICANPASTQNIQLGSHTWLLSTSTDHGAGQIYDYTTYSTAVGKTCYRIFLSTHSTNVEPKGQLPAFDNAHFKQVLDQITASFTL